jgi:hypothetical protein
MRGPHWIKAKQFSFVYIWERTSSTKFDDCPGGAKRPVFVMICSTLVGSVV